MTEPEPNPVYVVGHKNPDTDSIAAAIGYAALKRSTRCPQATPARLGDPNAETAYLLERFGVPAPILLRDVHTRVRDVMNHQPYALPTSATLREAAPLMRDKRLVPVVDDDRRLLGAVTLDDVAARYLEDRDLATGAQNTISYDAIVRTLDGVFATGEEEGAWRGRVWVAAMDLESMSVLVQPGDMVVVGDRHDAQDAVMEIGIACLVLVGGAQPRPELIEAARFARTRIILTPHDSYRVTRLLNLSIPVSEAMRTNAPTVDEWDLASEAQELLSVRGTIALPVIDQDRRLVGIVSSSDLLRGRGKGVILVDHNHRAQAVDGLEQAELLEVLDHHNLGDLRTPEPIYMKLEPVGSTSTIVAELYRQGGGAPEPAVAGMLAGGLVSDTLLFRSPTTTERDRKAGEWLAGIAGIDLKELAQGMFRANSNYAHTTPQQLLLSNLKLFEWGASHVGIGQAETVDIAYFSAKQEEFRQELRALKAGRGLDYALFLATDILAQSSVMLLPDDGERQLVERAFGIHPEDGCVELPGVVSRKKQVVPPLARELG